LVGGCITVEISAGRAGLLVREDFMIKETLVALSVVTLATSAIALPTAAVKAGTPVQLAQCSPCNPCAVAACNPCNPCAAAACNPCNPCAAN
jgi:hypothetical protein